MRQAYITKGAVTPATDRLFTVRDEAELVSEVKKKEEGLPHESNIDEVCRQEVTPRLPRAHGIPSDTGEYVYGRRRCEASATDEIRVIYEGQRDSVESGYGGCMC